MEWWRKFLIELCLINEKDVLKQLIGYIGFIILATSGYCIWVLLTVSKEVFISPFENVMGCIALIVFILLGLGYLFYSKGCFSIATVIIMGALLVTPNWHKLMSFVTVFIAGCLIVSLIYSIYYKLPKSIIRFDICYMKSFMFNQNATRKTT